MLIKHTLNLIHVNKYKELKENHKHEENEEKKKEEKKSGIQGNMMLLWLNQR